jgi:hypothetical protein
MTLDITPVQLLAAIGVLLTIALVWRAGSRKARKAAETARAGARVVSLAGRVLLMAGIMLGVQWVVITHPGSSTLLVVVLLVPDLIAAHVLTRALTVTSLDTTNRRGGRR